MRGEYVAVELKPLLKEELPPRARRIRHRAMAAFKQDGTTSACAENTPLAGMLTRFSGNYLRVRGEYNDPEMQDLIRLELPPRARRIPYQGQG